MKKVLLTHQKPQNSDKRTQSLFSHLYHGAIKRHLKKVALWIFVVLLFIAAACDPLPSNAVPTSTPAPSLAANVPLPTVTVPPSPTPEPTPLPGTITWAMSAFSDSTTADPDFAAGEPDIVDCSMPVLPAWAPFASDQPEFLTLNYPVPLMASQLEITYIGNPEEILRVEVLSSLSGLGRLIHDAEETPLSPPVDDACPAKLSLPINVDFEVDVVIITIAASQKPVQIDAAGLTGELLGYVDVPVFWRVPLPGTPVSLATGENGQVFAITAPRGLYAYDVEGNQLEEFSIPNEAQLTDVSTDQTGNLLVIDKAYGWYILMTPEGEHLVIGGDGLAGSGAIDPLSGNVYILQGNVLLVFEADTARLIGDWALDEISIYDSLVFDSQGRMFALRNPQWQPELVQLDPETGEELDAIPLMRANQYYFEIVARDLAVDASGNFYILFGLNTGQIAVHVLDPQGTFLRRFGRLTTDMDDWPEGALFDPHAITVSADGRFILVADGYEENAYLTAFLMEMEE